MPTYHYACDKCGNEFEVFQNISDTPKKRCPKCRGKIYRVIHPVNHILKGSGFYKTDYRDEDFSKKEKEEKEQGAGKRKEEKGSEESAKEAAKETKPDNSTKKTELK
ncbi:MAG: FmdB family zinc ribbon protein [Candidatus Krumholzibacteriota bacterium]|nr:FmdB family zinc ribbon protein [Candidatus Krumholzibacteriota bacterium]